MKVKWIIFPISNNIYRDEQSLSQSLIVLNNRVYPLKTNELPFVFEEVFSVVRRAGTHRGVILEESTPTRDIPKFLYLVRQFESEDQKESTPYSVFKSKEEAEKFLQFSGFEYGGDVVCIKTSSELQDWMAKLNT